MRSDVGGVLGGDKTSAERDIFEQLPVGQAIAVVCQVGWQCYPSSVFDFGSVQDVDTLRQGRHSADEVNIRFAKLVGMSGGKRHDGFALRFDPGFLQHLTLDRILNSFGVVYMRSRQLEPLGASLLHDKEFPCVVNHDGTRPYSMGRYERDECLLKWAAHQGQSIGQTAMEGEPGSREDRNALGTAYRQCDPCQRQALVFDEGNQRVDSVTQRLRVIWQ